LELFRICREELFTAVVGDVMDLMGHQHQFLPPQIQPLRDDMIVVGRAMPVLSGGAWLQKPESDRTRFPAVFSGISDGEDEVCRPPSRVW
jgi:hypothetical protein